MNVFPSIAVDPSNGNVSATWSDGSNVYLSTSLDQGGRWPAATVVNTAPARTAVLPWVATRNGQVDVVYYGADSANTSSAIWNVYLAETTDGVSFTQSLVSNQPNHVGVLCTHGDACLTIERTLLDLFQLAFDPVNGKVAIIYTADTLATTDICYGGQPNAGLPDCPGNPLPELVLAQQL